MRFTDGAMNCPFVSAPSATDPVAVRPLRREELGAAAQVLARAFLDDPGFQYALPERPRRHRDLAWLYRGVLRAAWLRGGHVDAVGSGPDAVALWLDITGPYDEPLFDLLRAGLAPTPLVLGLRATRRLSSLSAAMIDLHRRHAPRIHVYLQLVGVEPTAQGRGLGSTLLTTGLARADATRRAVYLETETARNLPLYERFGFEVRERVETIPGVPLWSLVRPARAA